MELPLRGYQEYSFYHCFEMCRTMAAGTVILMSTNTLTLACTNLLCHSLHVFISLYFCLVTVCVLAARPPGRPATQADGAFPVKNLSIYL